jgi:transposase-like protein
MNIVDRAQAFAKSLGDLANRSAWEWRRCPKCGNTDTVKYGTYPRRLWCLEERRALVIQRHKCNLCSNAAGKTVTYSETSALRVRGSWYAREVHRLSVDYWLDGRSSVRRTAEFVRSLLGHQERWQMWRPLDPEPNEGAQCHLGVSTVHRWLDGAGRVAEQTVKQQLEGVGSSGQVGTDGLWAGLRGRGKRVVLALVDCVSGLIWPPVVVKGEDKEGYWRALFARGQEAGLDADELRGLVSDGAQGLIGYLNKGLVWVNHQRCVLHIWRNLAGELARKSSEAAVGLKGQGAKAVREQARRELVGLIHGVIDAPSGSQGQVALAKLGAHPLGAGLAAMLEWHLDTLWVYVLAYNKGLLRVAPEWVWRDFRLRVSRGRNHGSEGRLERAGLVWAIYHNFTPAQWRSERRRHYRHPGRSALEVAGASPGGASYLDALGV